jgi:Protein tyrosine and serine/threonine kinase
LEQVLQNDYEWKLISGDVMEVQQDQINVLETIGEGAFGLVKKGILRISDNKSQVVAIKMLKSKNE